MRAALNQNVNLKRLRAAQDTFDVANSSDAARRAAHGYCSLSYHGLFGPRVFLKESARAPTGHIYSVPPRALEKRHNNGKFKKYQRWYCLLTTVPTVVVGTNEQRWDVVGEYVGTNLDLQVQQS